MPSPAGVLFPQVTETPSREFIAAQLKAAGCKKLVVPAAGRFAAAAAAVPVLGGKNITCADTGLIPSILGTLADPKHPDLVLTMPDRPGLAVFLDGPRDRHELAAGVMLAVRYAAMRRDTAYMAEQAKAVRAAAKGLRTWLAGQLRAQAEALTGISYRVAPVAETVAGAPDDAAVFADLRGWGTRTRKELAAAECLFWDQPPDPFDVKADAPALLAVLGEREQLAVCCVAGERLIPEGWVRLAVTQTAGARDYVIASRDPGGRLVKTRRAAGPATEWPLYAEQEIGPASVVGMAVIDRDTALHYRDLMVHRLPGSTVSERYYLFLVDGRAATVFGMHFRDQVVGKTEYCAETFGISITSQRYARLGKLFMLCLTSRDMLAFLLHTSPGMLQRNPPIGVQTSSPTIGHEGKADRGVMTLVSREPKPGGGFHLVYRTGWRPEGWGETVARWHREQAWHCRPGWEGPRLEQPQPEVKKRKRGRGRNTE